VIDQLKKQEKPKTKNNGENETKIEETPAVTKVILEDFEKLKENLGKEDVIQETIELAQTTDKLIVDIKDQLHRESLQKIDYRKFSNTTKDSLNFISRPIQIFSHNLDMNINRLNNSDLQYRRNDTT